MVLVLHKHTFYIMDTIKIYFITETEGERELSRGMLNIFRDSFMHVA